MFFPYLNVFHEVALVQSLKYLLKYALRASSISL